MKLISWNVNGLRAAVTKGFMESFNELDADIFCLQETKLQPEQISLELPGYEQYWNSAVKKGYSGTAVFTRIKPLSVTNGIGIEEHDQEGRVITAEYDNFYLVCCYTPNSQRELARLEYRMTWEDAFRNYLLELDKKKPVILCGDLNVAHQDTFRHLYPDAIEEYSWWSYMGKARERNTGWRIDYFITSKRLDDKIQEAKIHQQIFGSDHCPVELDIDL